MSEEKIPCSRFYTKFFIEPFVAINHKVDHIDISRIGFIRHNPSSSDEERIEKKETLRSQTRVVLGVPILMFEK
jgi:hypothetical protein